MGSIIPLPASEHHQFQLLLPWYVTGKLDQLEHARVENHLAACAECQAELRLERWLDAEISELPLEVEHGWQRLEGRIAPEPEATARGGPTESLPLAARTWRAARVRSAPYRGWAIATSCALLLLAVGSWTLPRLQVGQYQALGAAPAAGAGNVVVIFRPEVLEKSMRETLKASEARIVDGPTAADAYILHVPPGQRLSALAKLRASGGVVMAQPIDPGRSP
ncbi:MAG: hypothetical protein JWO33_2649 [Caulobacteraceae bacterium]|nr:hypothetical protein [Caulobacteraceae bacterium]